MNNQNQIDELKKMMARGQIDGDELRRRFDAFSSVDDEKAWKEILEKNSTSGRGKAEGEKADDAPDRDAGENNGRLSHFRLYASRLYRVAAVLLLFFVGGAFWYYYDYTRVTPPVISEEIQLAMQQSREGGHEAAEIVSAGTPNKEIITKEERVLYHVDEDFAEQLAEAKRITTYQNKEYWVTLDDGTLVHLNNNSRLIYPEKFGDRRDVILEGEAYFMVAKDKSRQFVVHTPQGDVRVYGTEFNVNTRADASGNAGQGGNAQLPTSVVLVSGSVSFTPANGQELMLQPGQELLAANGQHTIGKVDTAPYVAWNEGKFLFQAWPLERVMNVLSRWYGLQVQFGSEGLRKKQLDGYFSRYDGIDSILESIETVLGVDIKKDQNTIIIN